MADPIVIEDLPTTVLPSAEHAFAAMKEGLTVQLTVQQVIDLVVAVIVGGAPVALDTLVELAAAFGDDEDALTNLIASVSNVDNTSDANKPVSDATQTALDDKLSSDDFVIEVGEFTTTGGITIPLPAGFDEGDCIFYWVLFGAIDSGYEKGRAITGTTRTTGTFTYTYNKTGAYMVVGRK